MKSIASKKAGPGGPSSYISHISTQLYMHRTFGLCRYIGVMDVDISHVVEIDEELAGVAGEVFAFGGLAHG